MYFTQNRNYCWNIRGISRGFLVSLQSHGFSVPSVYQRLTIFYLYPSLSSKFQCHLSSCPLNIKMSYTILNKDFKLIMSIMTAFLQNLLSLPICPSQLMQLHPSGHSGPNPRHHTSVWVTVMVSSPASTSSTSPYPQRPVFSKHVSPCHSFAETCNGSSFQSG